MPLVRPIPNRFAKGLFVEIITLQPIVALVAGILILIIPRLLSYIVALYLIFIGLTGLFPDLIAQLTSGSVS
ncbi:DUF3096 domain-containing protein [Fulvimarina endophytica]|uniref:DUF3096 domain-containing protein n=1 Tax=Fulvimarina endophytica TaxID=2293836 RepID=A0A371X0D1_9HYPH|nr:DUF3096 domain-containing protein [Fulvimarina endophytica]